jgi:hypothetical protein
MERESKTHILEDGEQLNPLWKNETTNYILN